MSTPKWRSPRPGSAAALSLHARINLPIQMQRVLISHIDGPLPLPDPASLDYGTVRALERRGLLEFKGGAEIAARDAEHPFIRDRLVPRSLTSSATDLGRHTIGYLLGTYAEMFALAADSPTVRPLLDRVFREKPEVSAALLRARHGS